MCVESVPRFWEKRQNRYIILFIAVEGRIKKNTTEKCYMNGTRR